MLISDARITTESNPRASTLYKVATERKEFEASFGLVYQGYLHRGLTTPNAWEMRITPYQISPDAHVFVAIDDGSVVSTLTLVEDGENGLPMESLFQDEINAYRRQRLRLAEVSCLAHGRPGERLGWEIAERLMSLMAQFAASRDIDRLLITVCPQHTVFYRRIAFRPFGEVRSYSEVCGKPAVPMQVDLRNLAVDNPSVYDRFFSKPFLAGDLASYRIPAALVRRFGRIMNETEGVNTRHVRQKAAYQMAG
jgi:hypothetical protein